MKRWIVVLVLMGVLLAGCTPYSELVPKTPRDVLDVTMYVLTGGSSAQPLIIGNDGKPAYLSAPTGLAAMISEKVTYEVVSITENGDSATAVLKITAPDTVNLVYDCLEGMETYDEEAFTARMEETLKTSTATVSNTVELQLQKVEGSWCIVMDPAFSDAITGGLMTRYNEVQQAIFDAFQKGGEG